MSQFTVSYVFQAVNKMTAPVRRIAQSIQGMTRSTEAVAQASRASATAGAAAAQSTQHLANASNQATQSLNRKSSALRAATTHTQAATQATDRLRAAEERLQSRLATAASATFVGSEMRKVGRVLTGPLLGSVSVAERFEETMSKVAAVSNATDAQLAELTQTARKLGATTSFSASEAAEGMTYLSMAGFSVNETIAAMPGVLNLAKASATGLGRTADIASNILSGFGLEASEMGRVGDVLTATFTTSNSTLDSLGDAMSYAAPQARALGMTVEQTAAMVALMHNVGIQGSRAGTATTTALANMAAPSREALGWMQKLGVQMRTTSGDLRDPLALFKELADATASLGTADRSAAFTSIFGKEASAAMMKVIEAEGEGGLTAYFTEIARKQGESARVAAKMSDNLAGVRKEWQSAVESLQISIGNALIPTMRIVFAGLTRIVRAVNAIVDRFPNLSKVVLIGVGVLGALATAAGVAISAFAALYGTLAMAQFGMARVSIQATLMAARLKVASLASATGRAGVMRFLSSLTGLTRVFPAVIGGIRAIGVAVAANPIGLIVTALIGAGLLIWTFWDQIKGFFGWIWAKAMPIRSFFSGFWDGLVEGFGPTLAGMGEMRKTAEGLLQPFMALIRTALVPLSAGFERLRSIVSTAFRWVWNTIAKVVPGMDQITAQTMSWGQMIGRVFGFLANLILWPLYAVGQLAKGFNWVLEKVKALVSPIKTFAGWAGRVASWFGGGEDSPSKTASKTARAAGAAVAIAAPAMAATPSLPPPAEPTPMVMPASGGDVVDNSTFAPQITINGSGLSAEQLQLVIRAEMDRAAREDEARRRNRLYD